MAAEELLKGILAELGSTPTAVADTLSLRGTKGGCAPDTCPIAQEVRRKFEKYYPDATVNVSIHSVYATVSLDGGPGIKAPLPDACQGFIWEYDSGAHQDLCESNN